MDPENTELQAFVDGELESAEAYARLNERLRREPGLDHEVQALRQAARDYASFFEALSRGPLAPPAPPPPAQSTTLAAAAPSVPAPISDGAEPRWGFFSGVQSANELAPAPAPAPAPAANPWGRLRSAEAPAAPAVQGPDSVPTMHVASAPLSPFDADVTRELPPASQIRREARHEPNLSQGSNSRLSPGSRPEPRQEPRQEPRPEQKVSGETVAEVEEVMDRPVFVPGRPLVPASASSDLVDSVLEVQEPEFKSLDELIGQRLGGYRVDSALASGGMGAVFRATQMSMDRTVALKVLAPRLQRDSVFVRRFAREARAAARIDHPNLVRIYDVGQDRGCSFYSMELVEGSDLKDMLERGPIEVPEALRWTIQACEAMEAAHSHGIVHRDLKPANLLVETKTGQLKIADLGLAKEETPGGDGAITLDKTVMGSPNYMSPEQAEDVRQADAQSDVYALGATLYHMVTGEAPYGRGKPVEILARMLTEDLVIPDPAGLPPLDEDVREIIELAMSRDRSERFADMVELREALEDYLAEGPRPISGDEDEGLSRSGVTRAARPSRRAAETSPVIALLCVVAGVGIGALAGSVALPKKVEKAVPEPPARVPLIAEATRPAEKSPVTAPATTPNPANPEADPTLDIARITEIEKLLTKFDNAEYEKLLRELEALSQNAAAGAARQAAAGVLDREDKRVRALEAKLQIPEAIEGWRSLRRSIVDLEGLLANTLRPARLKTLGDGNLKTMLERESLGLQTEINDAMKLCAVDDFDGAEKALISLDSSLIGYPDAVLAPLRQARAAVAAQRKNKAEAIERAFARGATEKLIAGHYRACFMAGFPEFNKALEETDGALKREKLEAILGLLKQHREVLEKSQTLLWRYANAILADLERKTFVLEPYFGLGDTLVAGPRIAEQKLLKQDTMTGHVTLDDGGVVSGLYLKQGARDVRSFRPEWVRARDIIERSGKSRAEVACFLVFRGDFAGALDRIEHERRDAEAAKIRPPFSGFESLRSIYQKTYASLIFEKLSAADFEKNPRLANKEPCKSWIAELLGNLSEDPTAKDNRSLIEGWAAASTAPKPDKPSPTTRLSYRSIDVDARKIDDERRRELGATEITPHRAGYATIHYDFLKRRKLVGWKPEKVTPEIARSAFVRGAVDPAFANVDPYELKNGEGLRAHDIGRLVFDRKIKTGFFRMEIEALASSPINLALFVGEQRSPIGIDHGAIVFDVANSMPDLTATGRSAPGVDVDGYLKLRERKLRIMSRRLIDFGWMTIYSAPPLELAGQVGLSIEFYPKDGFKTYYPDAMSGALESASYVMLFWYRARGAKDFELVAGPLASEGFQEGLCGIQTFGAQHTIRSIRVTTLLE